MPQDDPTAHQYMRCVDGMKGWKHWYDNGTRHELENPSWRNELPLYSQTSDDGAVKLDVDSGLKLAYVHSPNHQRQLDELYLSALDVTRERFLLDTQFFGGYDAFYNHAGRLTANGESNGLTLGRGTAANPLLQARRSTATAGTLVAGVATAFVFDFTTGDTNFASSLANFSIMQPLLRGAGRDIALEGLTDAERRLLANLRAYAQFRQGFYTQVAIGELGVTGPQRGGPTTRLTSFSGSGGVGGYVGLLQQLQ